MMSKTQKISKGQKLGFVPDFRHAVETVGESDVFVSPVYVDSEDSFVRNSKTVSLNMEKSRGFNVPVQFFSLSKLSFSRRKELEARLRAELEKVRVVQKQVSTKNTPVPAKKEEKLLQQKNPKLDRVNPGKTLKPAQLQMTQQVSKTLVSNTHVMLMKQCETLLKHLMSHQYGWVFNKPVDVVKLNIPDYFQVIKTPMDFGTIKRRISSGYYSNPRDFASDVRLTFTNAITYNPPGNDVHIMANIMSNFFEARWKPIEKKLESVDSSVRIEERECKEETKQVLPKKRKPVSPLPEERVKIPKMTVEKKLSLSRRLESIVGELPENIIDFLRRNISADSQSGEDEIEVDIDSLGNDILLELERLLDEYWREKQSGSKGKSEVYEAETLNESGLSNSSMNERKGLGQDLMDEDVDIGGNEPPLVASFSPMVIEKDDGPRNNKCSTSSSSSGNSRSTSRDLGSSSSSGSGSDVKASTPGKSLHGASLDREKKSLNHQVEREEQQHKTGSTDSESQREGENDESERQQVSPGKQYRAALLRGRFADTILKAREKTLDQVAKKDPEKLRREREELERLQREEKARLQAEAKAAEDARKQAAAEEAKKKRELEREAARLALQQMEKTVEINEGNLFLNDLEILRTEHMPSSVGGPGPAHLPDGLVAGFRPGKNPLEQLGLYIKPDEDEEEEPEPTPLNDVEEGEID